MKKSNVEHAIDQMATMSRQFGSNEALSWLIGGRDCMIVSRDEIDSAVNRLSAFVGFAQEKGDLAAFAELKGVLGYAQGIQYSHLSLRAAGIEAAAA